MPYARHLEEAALPRRPTSWPPPGAGGGGRRWLSSGCRRSAPTWTAAQVLEWLVKPGDSVHRGDVVAVVDTDKADIDVEAFEDGVIAELLVEPGTEVPVGTALARSRRPAPRSRPRQPPPGSGSRRAGQPSPPASPPAKAAPAPPCPATKRARRPRASARLAIGPARSRPARGLALEDIPVPGASVGRRGCGRGAGGRRGAGGTQGGARLRSRPRAAAPRPDRQVRAATRHRRADGPLQARDPPLPRVRDHRLVGRPRPGSAPPTRGGRLAERLLMAAVLLKASALAARQVPALNGFWDEENDRLRPSEAVHLGVAVSLRGGGLVAPAIHEADRLTLDELMASLRDLVGRARSGRLRSSEMADPTITVTNLGDQGADEVHGVIYPPRWR